MERSKLKPLCGLSMALLVGLQPVSPGNSDSVILSSMQVRQILTGKFIVQMITGAQPEANGSLSTVVGGMIFLINGILFAICTGMLELHRELKMKLVLVTIFHAALLQFSKTTIFIMLCIYPSLLCLLCPLFIFCLYLSPVSCHVSESYKAVSTKTSTGLGRVAIEILIGFRVEGQLLPSSPGAILRALVKGLMVGNYSVNYWILAGSLAITGTEAQPAEPHAAQCH